MANVKRVPTIVKDRRTLNALANKYKFGYDIDKKYITYGVERVPTHMECNGKLYALQRFVGCPETFIKQIGY